MKSELFDLKYQINVQRTIPQTKKTSSKSNTLRNSNSRTIDEKNINRSATSEKDYSPRYVNFNLSNERFSHSNKKKEKLNSNTENVINENREKIDNLNCKNPNNYKTRHEILSLSSERRGDNLSSLFKNNTDIKEEKKSEIWYDVSISFNTAFFIKGENKKQGHNEIKIYKNNTLDNENEMKSLNNSYDEKYIPNKNDKIIKLMNDINDDKKLSHQNTFLRNEELINENSILKERFLKLKQRLNDFESILKEYQLLINKRNSFNDLLEIRTNDFTVYDLRGNSREINKSPFKQGILHCKCMQLRNREDLTLNDSLNEDKYMTLRNNIDESKSMFLSKTSQKQLKEPYMIVKNKIGLFTQNNDYQISKETDISIDRHNLTTTLNRENKNNSRNILIEKNKEINELENSNENNFNNYCHIINLNKYNENKVINSLKDRFIELEFYNFSENNRRFEAIYKLIDSIYEWVIDIKNLDKNILLSKKTMNNDAFNYELDDLINSGSPKKIEELLRIFLIGLSNYSKNHQEFSNNKSIDILSVIRNEEALLFPNDIGNLYEKVQNLVLMENELENYILDNKKLLIEFSKLAEDFNRISKEVEEYKAKIEDLENEVTKVRSHYADNIRDRTLPERRENDNELDFTKKIKNIEMEKLRLSRDLVKSEEENKYLKKELEESKNYLIKMKVSEMSDEIINLKSRIVMNDKIISNLKAKIGEKSKNESKNNQFKELINNLKNDIREKDNIINQITSEARRKETLTHELEKQICWMKKQLNISKENFRIHTENKNSKLVNIKKIESVDLEELKSVSQYEKIETILTTIIHSFSELFVKIYSLIEKNINKGNSKLNDLYYSSLGKISI